MAGCGRQARTDAFVVVVVTPITAAIDLLPTLVSLAGIERVGDQPLDSRVATAPGEEGFDVRGE